MMDGIRQQRLHSPDIKFQPPMTSVIAQNNNSRRKTEQLLKKKVQMLENYLSDSSDEEI